jgi:hypothetical protein
MVTRRFWPAASAAGCAVGQDPEAADPPGLADGACDVAAVPPEPDGRLAISTTAMITTTVSTTSPAMAVDRLTAPPATPAAGTRLVPAPAGRTRVPPAAADRSIGRLVRRLRLTRDPRES